MFTISVYGTPTGCRMHVTHWTIGAGSYGSQSAQDYDLVFEEPATGGNLPRLARALRALAEELAPTPTEGSRTQT